MRHYVHEKRAVSSDPVEAPRYFIFQGIHPEEKVPVLEARFRVERSDELKTLPGSVPNSDTDLIGLYYPTECELEAIIRRFEVMFEIHGWTVRLHDEALRGACPSTCCILAMNCRCCWMVQSSLQLKMESIPPYKHDGEDRFDIHVAAGRLYKEVVLEPLDLPVERKDGQSLRNSEVFTTPARAKSGVSPHGNYCGPPLRGSRGVMVMNA